MRLFARLLFGLTLLFPSIAFAQGQCVGTDLIDTLEPSERDAILSEASDERFGNGLLWQAFKDDTVITIFGTYHFKHAETLSHLDRLKPFIDQADKVYLEISTADQAEVEKRMASDPSLMFITEGPTLPDMLGEATWNDFKAQMEARNIPGFFAAKFKPLWAALMLGIGPCEAQAGALQGGGIDELVGQYAEEIGTPSRSLEEFAVLLTLLDGMPIEQQINMIKLSLAWPGNMDDLSYTIRERYLAEEVTLTWIFSRYISLKFGGPTAEEDFAMFTDLLLERRNKDWMTVLERDVQNGDEVVIAVGAAHLPGEIGILNLLEQRGYTISRLPLVLD